MSQVQLALHNPLKCDLTMTDELTLTVRVLKVKDIKETVIAARQENISSIVLARKIKAEYMDLNRNLRAGLTAHFVDRYRDIDRLAFDSASARVTVVVTTQSNTHHLYSISIVNRTTLPAPKQPSE